MLFNALLQLPLHAGVFNRYSERRGRWDSISWSGCILFFPRHLEYSVTVFSAIDYIAKTPEGLFPFLNLSCFWLMEIFFPFTAR